MHTIEIRSDGPGATTLLLDGHELQGVQRFRLEQGVADPRPKLTLILHPLTVLVNGKEVDVTMYKPGNVT